MATNNFTGYLSTIVTWGMVIVNPENIHSTQLQVKNPVFIDCDKFYKGKVGVDGNKISPVNQTEYIKNAGGFYREINL